MCFWKECSSFKSTHSFVLHFNLQSQIPSITSHRGTCTSRALAVFHLYLLAALCGHKEKEIYLQVEPWELVCFGPVSLSSDFGSWCQGWVYMRGCWSYPSKSQAGEEVRAVGAAFWGGHLPLPCVGRAAGELGTCVG